MVDSIVLVADDEIVKIHVHTNHPGQAFEKTLTYGALSTRIDNMREEHQEKLIRMPKACPGAGRTGEEGSCTESCQSIRNTDLSVFSVGEGLSTPV